MATQAGVTQVERCCQQHFSRLNDVDRHDDPCQGPGPAQCMTTPALPPPQAIDLPPSESPSSSAHGSGTRRTLHTP